MAEEETRLRAVEEKIEYLDTAIREIERALEATQNGIFAVGWKSNIKGSAPPPPTYPVQGGVLGCSAFQNGISVSILASDGHTYGPVTTASGGSWTISVPAGPATITYDPSTGTTYQQRFTGGTQSFTVPASTSSAGNYTLGIAAGYACLAICSTPIKTTLNGSSAACGAFTLTYNSGAANWQGSMSQNIPAQPAPGTCPAASGVTVDFTLINSGVNAGNLQTTMSSNSSTLCPQAGGAIQYWTSSGPPPQPYQCAPLNLVYTRGANTNTPWCAGWNTGDTITITE